MHQDLTTPEIVELVVILTALGAQPWVKMGVRLDAIMIARFTLSRDASLQASFDRSSDYSWSSVDRLHDLNRRGARNP